MLSIYRILAGLVIVLSVAYSQVISGGNGGGGGGGGGNINLINSQSGPNITIAGGTSGAAGINVGQAANTVTVNVPFASQSEAEIGTNTVQYMNPLRTAQAIAALCPLPSQSGNAGKFLSTNGTVALWDTVSGGGGFSYMWTAAKAQNGVPGSNGNWGLLGSTSPVPVSYCPSGCDQTTTTAVYGVLQFDDTGTRTVSDSFDLPSSIPTIDVEFKIQTTGTSTSTTTFRVYTACVGASDSMDVTYGSAQSVNFTPTGTALQVLLGTLSGLDTSSCSGGDKLMFAIDRDTGDANTNTAELISAYFHQ